MQEPSLRQIKIEFKKQLKTIRFERRGQILTQYFSSLGVSPQTSIDQSIEMLYNKIMSYIPDCILACKQWMTCSFMTGCDFSALKNLITIEIESTLFILNILFNSVISPKNQNDPLFRISVNKNVKQFDGKWENDETILKVKRSNAQGPNAIIYAAGPTASGKTTWLKALINMLYMSYEKKFPLTFFNIDGGRFRELSLVYQLIKLAVRKKGYEGMFNLVNPTFHKISGELFNSTIIKSIIKHILKDPKLKNTPIIIPDTLSNPFNFRKVFEKDMNLVGNDKSVIKVYALIYQHFKAEECMFDGIKKLSCYGTLPSGTSREIVQGKRFSGDKKGWTLSMLNSLALLNDLIKKKDPNTKLFLIHNYGPHGEKFKRPKGWSIIQDFSVLPLYPESKLLDEAIYFTQKEGTVETKTQPSTKLKYQQIKRRSSKQEIQKNVA